MSLELLSLIIGIVMGLGVIIAGLYKFWSMPAKLEELKTRLDTLDKERDLEQEQRAKDATTKLQARQAAEQRSSGQLGRVAQDAAKLVQESEGRWRQETRDIYERINKLSIMTSSDRIEAVTAATSMREIQSNIRERLAAFEKLELVISSVLRDNAEDKAKIARLIADYQELNRTVQSINREIGEIKARKS